MKQVIIGVLSIGLWTSCIREEAPNAEADILKCMLPTDILYRTDIDYSLPFDAHLDAYPLYIQVQKGTDLSALAPKFELTPGATILPPSGSVQDFREPVRYTVTSEDRKWQREYAVLIRYPERSEIPTFYHFEQAEVQDNYDTFYEYAEDGTLLTWASGNPGYALTGNAKEAEGYPTCINPSGYIGNCAQLTTRTTGSLGEKAGKPIAAGNLFLGKFNLAYALNDALSATQMGVPFYHKPVKLTGYYQYKAGPQFYENGTYTNRKDTFSIYAFFYERTGDQPYMDGHLPTQAFQSPQMVALAQMDGDERTETEGWKPFELSFDYTTYEHPVDSAGLANGDYYLAIVFASSKDGDEFKGAPGSTLKVDEVKLTYE